jgi:hypothetical protein
VRAAAAIGAGLMAAAPMMTAGCGDSYAALFDSYPIALTRGPMGNGLSGNGALIATASPPDAGAGAFRMLVSTGSALTLLTGPAPTGALETERVGFDLLDPTSAAIRAQFRSVSLIRLPLQPVGETGFDVGGVLSGDILRRYSVDFRFGATCADGMNLCSSMTIWNHLGADLGFLQDSGYAVIRFALAGGGETTAHGDPDFLGQRAPLVLSPTRIVLRTCAVPADFSPDAAPVDVCCKEPDAERLATGTDLALVLDTGVGPLVLGARAWERVKASLPAPPVETPGDTPGDGDVHALRVATWPTPIPTLVWSTIPKYALVDLETGSATDPGPCVELGRARRLEQVSYRVVQDAMNQVATTACTQQCDNDPREPDKAQNSAAYIELTGLAPVPVAVIADEEPYLQGIRFDVRPEGPEVDGVLGAGALGRARVEIDYLSGPPQAVFSCEQGVARSECFAAARCPRLPDPGDQHLCFGLPQHGFAPACPSGC